MNQTAPIPPPYLPMASQALKKQKNQKPHTYTMLGNALKATGGGEGGAELNRISGRRTGSTETENQTFHFLAQIEADFT